MAYVYPMRNFGDSYAPDTICIISTTVVYTLYVYMLCFVYILYTQFIPNYYKFYRRTADDATVDIINDFLQRLNDLVKSHKGGFMSAGDSPTATAVDYLIWPWLERFKALKLISPGGFLHGTQPNYSSLFPPPVFPSLRPSLTFLPPSFSVFFRNIFRGG